MVVTVYPDLRGVVVRYSDGRRLALNIDVVTKVRRCSRVTFQKMSRVLDVQMDVPVFGYRDVVRVIDDMVQVYSLQDGHGGWNDDMALVNYDRNTKRICSLPVLCCCFVFVFFFWSSL